MWAEKLPLPLPLDIWRCIYSNNKNLLTKHLNSFKHLMAGLTDKTAVRTKHDY